MLQQVTTDPCSKKNANAGSFNQVCIHASSSLGRAEAETPWMLARMPLLRLMSARILCERLGTHVSAHRTCQRVLLSHLPLLFLFQGVFYAGGAQYANADLPGTIKGS